MKLAQNEQVVRKWEYASAQGFSKHTATLTVTNERIVHEVKSGTRLERQEIPVKSAKSIYASRANNILGIILLILAGLFLIYSFVQLASPYGKGMGAVLLVLAIAMGVIGYIFLKRCSMTLVITTEGRSEVGLSLGVFSRLAGYLSGTIRVHADRDTVDNMLENIGALIVDIKNLPQNADEPSGIL